jgi:hypothetical protein
MRLIVLSKTHELLLLKNRLGTAEPHSSCALYLSDNDVFSGLSLKRIPNSRGNLETPERPFLYDVICSRPRTARCNSVMRSEMVEPDGFEPTTSCLQSTRSTN